MDCEYLQGELHTISLHGVCRLIGTATEAPKGGGGVTTGGGGEGFAQRKDREGWLVG